MSPTGKKRRRFAHSDSDVPHEVGIFWGHGRMAESDVRYSLGQECGIPPNDIQRRVVEMDG